MVYKIRSDQHLLCQATEKAPDLRVIINPTSWDESTRVCRALVTLVGPDARLADLLREVEKLFDHVELVRQAKDQATLKTSASLEKLRATSNPISFALEYFGESAVLEPALIRDGHLNMRLIATRKVDLASMLAEYERGVKAGRWSDFKLVRIDEFDPEQQIHGAFTENLTQKQLEVIKTALALGFYNTPRDVTLDDLSNIFGISKAAVHNRLQAAERKVISKFFA